MLSYPQGATTIPQQVQRVNIRKYMHEKLKQKAPVLDDMDRGYHSSADPHMDKVSAEMYD